MDDVLIRKKLRIGQCLRWTAGIAATSLVLLVILQINVEPRTDDATVRANYIEIAAEVEGRLVYLPVHDNQMIRKGDLLFQIDPRSYQYSLETAESERDQLEQQIVDQRRHIASQHSATDAAAAQLQQSTRSTVTADTGIDVAGSSLHQAEATAARELATLNLAKDTYARIAPLLAKQFVTVQQVDDASTSVESAEAACREAQARVETAKNQRRQSKDKRQESDAEAKAAAAKLREAFHNIDTTDTLEATRLERTAKVLNAETQLERTRIVAPFDALVTNLNISEGAYAHVGSPVFTLIDVSRWYVIANFRESRLRHIHPGDHVEIYLMGSPDRRFTGVVESIGNGVVPEDGKTVEGLPDVSRTLNWVHLAARFPVRIRVQNPDSSLFRIGATAVTIVRE